MEPHDRERGEKLRLEARNAGANGDAVSAERAWIAVTKMWPDDPEAANALGNLAMRRGDAISARRNFELALARDPQQPALLFNLAAACRVCGDAAAAIAALDAALTIDPYFVQALFQKAVILEDGGRNRDAARIYRDFLQTVPPEVRNDPRYQAPLDRAEAAVRADDAELAAELAGIAGNPTRRIAGCLANLTRQGIIYRSEPTFLTVPELPSLPFFDRDLMPWLAELEDAWEIVRDEAMTVFHDPAAAFQPYVANPPGTPLNQWRELDHNDQWGAFFLWQHGVRNAPNCARMPRTDALLARLPLLQLDRRAPNVFLSRLAPHTHIPAHNGVTNARATVHLPLIVPDQCSFRVGPETRTWKPGVAWAFDDTIDHEAWNDSDQPRLILIIDAWNPLLTAAECDHLRSALAAYDRHYGVRRAAADEL